MAAKEITDEEISALERGIVAAVCPAEVLEIGGWIAAFDDTTVSRAKSAAPLSHEEGNASALARLRAEYAARSLKPMFRVPQSPVFARVAAELAKAGMGAEQPTDVQVASAATTALCGRTVDVRIDGAPDASWSSVFLGEGFDAVDGASRVRTLTRAPGSLFASIREPDGRVVAAGVLAFGHGWASVHGMRTALSHRGQRLATRVLASLAQAAIERGHDRLMLQVERANEAAQKLYARCGFERAWTYDYWRDR